MCILLMVHSDERFLYYLRVQFTQGLFINQFPTAHRVTCYRTTVFTLGNYNELL